MDPDVLAFCIRCLGEDSILFATGFPYEDSAAEAVFLRGADLTGSQRAKISHANAERLFRIPASGGDQHPQT